MQSTTPPPPSPTQVLIWSWKQAYMITIWLKQTWHDLDAMFSAWMQIFIHAFVACMFIHMHTYIYIMLPGVLVYVSHPMHIICEHASIHEWMNMQASMNEWTCVHPSQWSHNYMLCTESSGMAHFASEAKWSVVNKYVWLCVLQHATLLPPERMQVIVCSCNHANYLRHHDDSLALFHSTADMPSFWSHVLCMKANIYTCMRSGLACRSAHVNACAHNESVKYEFVRVHACIYADQHAHAHR